jgi:uncharacterized protein (TIGR02246 family)
MMTLAQGKKFFTPTLLLWAAWLGLIVMMPTVTSALPKGAESRPDVTDKDAVRKVLGRFVSAWNREDTDALVQLFLPEGSFISATGASATTRGDIKRLLTEERDRIFKGTTLTKTIHSITFEARHTAQVTGVYELEGLDMLMVPIAPDGAFRFVLSKKGNQWLIQKASIAHA